MINSIYYIRDKKILFASIIVLFVVVVVAIHLFVAIIDSK